MLNIVEGKLKRPQKVVIYGGEGLGKTTLVCKIPDVLVIDTEDGTAQQNVRRILKPQTWEELLQILEEVANTPGLCATLVVDTIDWAEQLCIDYVLKKYRQSSIESFGFGKGYTYVAEEFRNLLRTCDKVIQSGKNVVFTAHAKMRKFEQPDEEGAYDRWELKLSKNIAPLVKEWPDDLLFLNYKTYVVSTENNTKKAKGGERVIYTNHHPCWDAKNRHGFPDEMPLKYESVSSLFEESTNFDDSETAEVANDGIDVITVHKVDDIEGAKKFVAAEKALLELREKMTIADIQDEDIKKLVAKKGFYPEEIPLAAYSEEVLRGWILKNWEPIVNMIKSKQN